MKINCPHCRKEMTQVNDMYSWLIGKPRALILYFRCENDMTLISLDFRVVEEHGPK